MKQVFTLLIWILATITLSLLGNWVLGFAAAFLIIPLFRISLNRSIILGFCAGLLSWLTTAWYLDQSNLSQLSGMIGSLLQVKSSIVILGLTGIMGGIGVALAAWVAAKIFVYDNS